jgi:DNA-binding NtrC family response regulator
MSPGHNVLAQAVAVSYRFGVLRRIKDQRLVIVEDDVSIKQALDDYFSGQNTVIAFTSAEEALAAEPTLGDVQVFIIDYKLPGMDGGKLFHLLRRRFPGAKFILITGEMNYEVAENNRQLGWDALILKPFDFSILEDNISVLVAAAA